LVLDGVVSKGQQLRTVCGVPVDALLWRGLVEAPQVRPVVEEPVTGCRATLHPLAFCEPKQALLHIAALRAETLRHWIDAAPAVAEVHKVQVLVVDVVPHCAQGHSESLLGCALELGRCVPRSHRGLPVQELLLLLRCALLVPDGVEPRWGCGLVLRLAQHKLAHIAYVADLVDDLKHAPVNLPSH